MTMQEKKPPLGLKPRYVIDHQRRVEIEEAIWRYLEKSMRIPPQWIEELNEIMAREIKIIDLEEVK